MYRILATGLLSFLVLAFSASVLNGFNKQRLLEVQKEASKASDPDIDPKTGDWREKT